MKLTTVIAVTAFAFASFSVQARAQDAAPAPPPVQLSSKSVFLGMGFGLNTEYTTYVYGSAYQAFAKAGYTLTAKPAEAEITVDAHINLSTAVMNGDTAGGASVVFAISDSKTHTLLWTIETPINFAMRSASIRKNIDKAIGECMTSLTTLASGKLPEK